jgi:hypothetical protein
VVPEKVHHMVSSHSSQAQYFACSIENKMLARGHGDLEIYYNKTWGKPRMGGSRQREWYTSLQKSQHNSFPESDESKLEFAIMGSEQCQVQDRPPLSHL